MGPDYLYFAVVYTTTGEIHIKRHSTKEAAERCLADVNAGRFKDKVEYATIIRKDATKKSFKDHWVQ